MVYSAILFSLMASVLNAISAVVQRREASNFEAGDMFSRHLTASLTRNKMWLLGMAAQVAAFFLQAAALKFGLLSLVEPIMTTDLLFMLAILYFILHVRLGKREWIGAFLIVAGLSTLLAIANPHGGHITFNWVYWAITGGVIGLAVILASLYGKRLPHPSARAGLMGLAAGMGFALTAALTKLVVNEISTGGFLSLFTTWGLYALAFSGIASVYLTQNTYTAGPLAASQPAMMTADPGASIVIGVLMFGDQLNFHPWAIAGELAGGLLLVAGIIMLTGSPAINKNEQVK